MSALSLPTRPRIAATQFGLSQIQALNPMRNGKHQVIETNDPLWACELETTELGRALAGQWKWRIAKTQTALAGEVGTLLLYDASRPRPLAYYDATPGDSPWGAPQIVAIDRSAGTIDLEGFEPGAVVSAGDYGHWQDGPARRLQICGPGVADGSGNLSGLRVEPPPPFASDALPCDFEMEYASAEMSLVEAKVPFNAPVTHQATLKAGQIIRRA